MPFIPVKSVIHSKRDPTHATLSNFPNIKQVYIVYSVCIALPEVSCSAILLGSCRAKLIGLQVVRTYVDIKQKT